MREDELEGFLHERIPLSRAMAVSVEATAGGRVLLRAPLAPNVNHRDTAFGGSVASLATLAAWSAVFTRMRDEALPGRIVIRRNAMSFDLPVTGGFTATAGPLADDDWAKLRATLARGRTARIRVDATVACDAGVAGRFEGEFAVLPPAGDAG